MIATLTALFTLAATIIGVGKGGIDLFQSISALFPKTEKKLLSQLEEEISKEEKLSEKEREKISADTIYAALEQSSQKVAQILRRVQMDFYATVSVISLILVLLVCLLNLLPKFDWYANAISSRDNTLINLIMDLISLSFAWYFARWPLRLKRIVRIKDNLYQIRLISGTDKDGSTVDEISRLESNIAREIKGLVRETKLDNIFDRFRNFIKYYFGPLSISATEGDLLEAHLQLSTLVATTEAFLLKTALLEAQPKMQEMVTYKLHDILFDTFIRLIRLEKLTSEPILGETDEHNEWETRQKETIRAEIKRLGLDYLLPHFNKEFYVQNYPLLEKNGNLRSVLDTEISTAQNALRIASKSSSSSN